MRRALNYPRKRQNLLYGFRKRSKRHLCAAFEIAMPVLPRTAVFFQTVGQFNVLDRRCREVRATLVVVKLLRTLFKSDLLLDIRTFHFFVHSVLN